MPPVYVFGHINPDTDSICSAIAHAHLKNTESPVYFPARLGETNRETRFLLRTFDVEEPDFLPHVYIRAQDIMHTDVISAPTDSTVFSVGELMRTRRIHSVPIVDEEGRPKGVITIGSMARSFLQELELRGFQHRPTRVGHIADTLGGQLVVGDPTTPVQGNVLIGAMSPESMVRYVAKGDVVVVGDRENAQEAALRCDIACLILTGGFVPSPDMRQLAAERGAAIITASHDTYATARQINLSAPATDLAYEDMLIVTPDTLVKELDVPLVESPTALALVNDEDGHLIGVVTKSDLVTKRRRQVILVDHSERSLSAPGIEQAEILEIVDHHRLGGLETMDPLLALIAPVGCTSTLIFRRYREMGVVPPREIAGLMIGAILSDTMLLQSPTTTPEDVAAIESLGKILGEAPLALGARMFDAKFDIAAMTPGEIVANDLKASMLGSKKVGISQIEVGDATKVMSRKAELLAAMAELQARQGFDLLILLVTNIVQKGTELLALGETRVVEKAFGVSLRDHGIYLPGVLSRKKQVMPAITRSIS